MRPVAAAVLVCLVGCDPAGSVHADSGAVDLSQLLATAAPAPPVAIRILQPAPSLNVAWSFDVNLLGTYAWAMSPLVVHLTDDNFDQQITTSDDPDLIVSYKHEFTSVRFLTAVDGMTLSTHWSVPDLAANTPVVAGDVDGDLVADFVYQTTSGAIQAIDATGSVLWTSTVMGTLLGNTLAIADVDTDGNTEVLAGNMLLAGNNGAILATFGTALPKMGQLEVADLDQDGIQEIIVGSTAYDPTGAALWTAPGLSTSFWDHTLTVVDEDGNGFGELLAVADNQLTLVDHNGVQIRQVNLASGMTTGFDTWCIGDFDGDNVPEIARTYGSNLFAPPEEGVMEELTGTLRWTKTFTSNPAQSSVSGGCSAVDLDGNGVDEVVFNGDGGVSVRSGTTGASLQSRTSTGFALPPTVADLDGDGDAEIITVSGDMLEALHEVNSVWSATVQPAWLGRNHTPGRLGPLGATPAAAWFVGSDMVRGN